MEAIIVYFYGNFADVNEHNTRPSWNLQVWKQRNSFLENTVMRWLPLCGAAPAFNLHFLPCLPQLFSFKNRGLQEPPSNQRVVRKTLHKFLMKCDMPDKPGLLEACYFEVFSYAALPFNLEMFIQTRWWNQIGCATLDLPVEIRKSYILDSICDN